MARSKKLKKKQEYGKKEKLGEEKYLLRFTTYRDTKGERVALKKVKRKHRIEYEYKYKRVTVKDKRGRKHKVVKKIVDQRIYISTAYFGNTIAETRIRYIKRDTELMAKVIVKERKKFQKSKKTTFSATSQLYQGKIRNKFNGVPTDQSKSTLTKAKKLKGLNRKMDETNLLDRVTDFINETTQIDISELYTYWHSSNA